jgi:hypothetical protein
MKKKARIADLGEKYGNCAPLELLACLSIGGSVLILNKKLLNTNS